MSATYLVRMAIDKELLGIYWADNIDMLAMLIDADIVDPMLCEIKKIKNGGIYWGPIDVKVPIPQDSDEPITDAIDKLPIPDLGGYLYEDLTSSKGWRLISDLIKFKTAYI